MILSSEINSPDYKKIYSKLASELTSMFENKVDAETIHHFTLKYIYKSNLYNIDDMDDLDVDNPRIHYTFIDDDD